MSLFTTPETRLDREEHMSSRWPILARQLHSERLFCPDVVRAHTFLLHQRSRTSFPVVYQINLEAPFSKCSASYPQQRKRDLLEDAAMLDHSTGGEEAHPKPALTN